MHWLMGNDEEPKLCFPGDRVRSEVIIVLLAYCEDIGGHCWKVAGSTGMDRYMDFESFWELAADAIFN